MRRIYIAMCCLWAGISGVCAQDNTNKVRITLRQAIQIAQLHGQEDEAYAEELRRAGVANGLLGIPYASGGSVAGSDIYGDSAFI